jgi:hypothetical protein
MAIAGAFINGIQPRYYDFLSAVNAQDVNLYAVFIVG